MGNSVIEIGIDHHLNNCSHFLSSNNMQTLLYASSRTFNFKSGGLGRIIGQKDDKCGQMEVNNMFGTFE